MAANTLGERIRDLRMKKSLTQIDLAKGICTPSMISQIESDRARPSYKILFAIAEKLETTIEALLDNVEMNLQSVSIYKMARAMVANKDYASAIPLLLELLEAPRPHISPIEVMLQLAESNLYIGQLDVAEKYLELLFDNWAIRQDTETLARVYMNMGLLDFYRKNYQLAVFHVEKALEEANKINELDVFMKAEVLMNLGVINEKMGKIKQAITLFEQATTLYDEKDRPTEMAKVYLELAKSHQRINDSKKAIEYSDRAAALFDLTKSQYLKTKVQLHAAIALGQAGREAEAVQTLETAIARFQEVGTAEDVGIAYAELAKVLLALHDIEKAGESCTIARSLLPELHLYQARVNRIQGKIALEQGNSELAMRYFQRSGECFKMLGEIGEWSETMAELSQLKIKEDDLSGAVHILETIRLETRNALNEKGILL